jgi:hypothetical protein
VTRIALSGFVILAMIAGTPAIAASVPTEGVRIPGATVTHIRDFYAQSDKVLYVRAQDRQWYKAEMAAPCWGLPQTDRLKIDMTDGTTLDSNSIVREHGERCQVASVSRVSGPDRHLLEKPY